MEDKRNLQSTKDYDDFDIFTKHLVTRLKREQLLKWRNKSTAMLVKKLYKEGYSVEDVFHFVYLNS